MTENILIFRRWKFSPPSKNSLSILDRDIIKEIQESKAKKVLILLTEEFPEISVPEWYKSEEFSNLKKLLDSNTDIAVDYITSFEYDAVAYQYKEIFNVNYWPTYWVNYSHLVFTSNNYIVKENEKIEKKFSCFNRRPTLHRQVMMDYLHKHNQLDLNLCEYTWHMNSDKYKFKYWDPNIRILDDVNKVKINNYFSVPDSYYQCFFDLVPETDYRYFYLTEKTVRPIFLKRPFITFGSCNFSQRLKLLGFELYDEIFDYGFDSEEDLEKRADLFAQMIKNISFYPGISYSKETKEKIEHNYQRAKKIALKNLHMPVALYSYIEKSQNIDEMLYKITHQK